MTTTAALIVSIILLIANGWFVLYEFALVRMRSSRLQELEDRGVRNAAHARHMHDHMNDYLGACQLGITIASLGLGWLAEPAVSELLHPVLGSLSHGAAVGVAFALITLMHIVYGELVPKAMAIQVPERALLWSTTPMRIFYAIFYIPLRALNALANLTLRVIGLRVRPHDEPSLSVEEIRIVVTDAYRQGEVSLDRSLLLENALDLGSLTVEGAMVPMARTDMLALEDSREQIVEKLGERRRSRYLLTEAGRVVGYVHVKDLGLQTGGVSLSHARRALTEMTAHTPLDVALRRLQRERTHIALVTDDHGVPLGIVTLEDVLEELVGEIHDEFEEVRVWNLADHVGPGAALVLDTMPSRDHAVRALVEAIAATVPAVDADAATQAVLRREAQASTSVGKGVAVPHARLAGLHRTCVAMARLEEPLPWRGDADPVRFLFLILTPAETPLEQNRALMRVARLVRDELLFARLAEAPTPEALLEVVRAADVVA